MADRDPVSKPQQTGPGAADVETYLRDHPDFLVDHPDLVNLLLPPETRRGDGVLDMQRYMLDRVRADLAKLQTAQNEILSASRSNLTSQNRIHASVLRVLEARTLEEMLEIVTTDLAVNLEVDAVALAFEAMDRLPAGGNRSTLRIVSRGAIDRIMGGARELTLSPDIEADATLFGGAAPLIRSQALLRLQLKHDAPLGLLAFGSRQVGKFHPGQGTELLSFLGKVVELSIRGWLERG